MLLGIPKESLAGETRVAATPKTVAAFLKLGFSVTVECDAGVCAGFNDGAYTNAGASVVDDVWQADVVLKINPPQGDELERMKEGTTLIAFIRPAQNETLLRQLATKKINVLAMDSVPRISRAQSLDTLSAMANIAGYRAVIEAAHAFGRSFNGQMTAAGKTLPAKVLVIGAGVAGLAAIGAAGSLGAIVRAFDVRAEVREQIESMGAEFLAVDVDEDATTSTGYAKETSAKFNEAAQALYAKQAKEVDVIITTALIPGRPAPKLINKKTADLMNPGAIIVDLAAANGGNCEYTVCDEKITTAGGVTVIGYTDFTRRLPAQASQLYGTTLLNLLKLLYKEGRLNIDFDDEVLRSLTVVKAGEVTWPPPPVTVTVVAPKEKTPPPIEAKAPLSAVKKHTLIAAALAALAFIIHVSPVVLSSYFMIFMLACVAGFYVVWNVTHALHTPLMSVTNAISGIIIIGALLQIGQGNGIVSFLAFIAILIASINIFGGFTVTWRMLKMFRKHDKD